MGAALNDWQLRTLREKVVALERSRPDTPMLIPLRLTLSDILGQRNAAEDRSEGRRQRRLAHAAMRQVGGVDHVPPEPVQDLIDRFENAFLLPEPDRLREQLAALQPFVETAPLDVAYDQVAAGMLRYITDRRAARPSLEALVARYPAGDPRRRPLLAHLAEARALDGDSSGASEAAAAAGIPDDDCRLVDTALPGLAGLISAGDYPALALRAEITGLSQMEFDVVANGTIARPRMLVSAPTLLFDNILLDRLNRATFATPLREGRPVRCRSAAARVLWRIPR
jgi:hypothetical protein